MKFLFVFFSLAFMSCSTTKILTSELPEVEKFNYYDGSGSYLLTREIKKDGNKLITRSQLTSINKNKKVLVEKSVTLSQMGSIQAKKTRITTLKPLASEFSVWLEGQKFSVFGETEDRDRSYSLKMDSPEIKWKGEKKINFPRSKYFCFYNQLWECLYSLQRFQVLKNLPDSQFEFYMIWDNYPYIQDQLTDVGYDLFSKANLKFEENVKDELKYTVEVDGQLINLILNPSYRIKKMVWVAQGIIILGLDVKIDEE